MRVNSLLLSVVFGITDTRRGYIVFCQIRDHLSRLPASFYDSAVSRNQFSYKYLSLLRSPILCHFWRTHAQRAWTQKSSASVVCLDGVGVTPALLRRTECEAVCQRGHARARACDTAIIRRIRGSDQRLPRHQSSSLYYLPGCWSVCLSATVDASFITIVRTKRPPPPPQPTNLWLLTHDATRAQS